MTPEPLQRTLFELPPSFDGETYDAKRDQARLSGQLAKVFAVMSDGRWHTLDNIQLRIGAGSQAAVSARIRDFRKANFGGHTVERRHLVDGLWQYRLIVREVGQ